VDEVDLLSTNPCKIKGAGLEKTEERPFLTIDQVMKLAAREFLIDGGRSSCSRLSPRCAGARSPRLSVMTLTRARAGPRPSAVRGTFDDRRRIFRTCGTPATPRRGLRRQSQGPHDPYGPRSPAAASIYQHATREADAAIAISMNDRVSVHLKPEGRGLR
jgi:hypothetical protein